jgi:hypothetical protein
VKRLVFLFDSAVEPWGVSLQIVRYLFGRLEGEGVECEVIDTHGMADERLDYWREQAVLAAVWHHQAIRQSFGSRRASRLPYFGRQVPALLVYEQGETRPTAVYPHTETRGDTRTRFSIEGYLEELASSLEGGQ